MQDVVEHFSARTLSSSSPPTLFGPLTAPSRQSLSGQLTGSCRAFPATRAAGKRPSAALFDVPSPLIRFTWTALCAHFVLNRSSTHALVLCFLCNYSSFYVSISLKQRPVQSQILPKLRDEDFRGLFFIYFPFFDLFSFSFCTLNMLSAGSCLDVCMVARSFAVVLQKCHIFPALPVWSCGWSGTWPAGPLPPLFWKTEPKTHSDQQVMWWSCNGL